MSEENIADQKNSNEDKDNISLSAAILAPLNAIFEAQVHAARAFLNFVFQMGFRHEYTPEDIEELKKDKKNENNRKILEEIEQRKINKETIDKLEKRTDLNEEERNELWNLKLKSDDLLMQRFDFFDEKGNDSSLFIPNLAILPIKPLAIDNANYKFELMVKECKEGYDQLRRVEGAAKDRPWFLIKPKRIEGQFSAGGGTEQTIKIEVNIGSADMPEGLDKLLTSLTNSSKITPKISVPKKT